MRGSNTPRCRRSTTIPSSSISGRKRSSATSGVRKSGSLLERKALRRRLGDGGCGGEYLSSVARSRRINPLAIDHALCALGGGAGHGNPPVPALGVHGSPGAEIEARHVIADVEREHRLADQIADDIMAG